MTGHGTQFVAFRTNKKGYSKHKFGEFLEENGIKHILARIHHPQTNGKNRTVLWHRRSKEEVFQGYR